MMQGTIDTSSPDGKLKAIEEYRQAVASTPDLTFKSFCERRGITNYKQILWWSSGHGISIHEIRHGGNSRTGDVTSPTFIQFRPRPRGQASALRNISVTFPDGVNLTLQESGVEELVSLLLTYQSRKQATGGVVQCSL